MCGGLSFSLGSYDTIAVSSAPEDPLAENGLAEAFVIRTEPATFAVAFLLPEPLPAGAPIESGVPDRQTLSEKKL